VDTVSYDHLVALLCNTDSNNW